MPNTYIAYKVPDCEEVFYFRVEEPKKWLELKIVMGIMDIERLTSSCYESILSSVVDDGTAEMHLEIFKSLTKLVFEFILFPRMLTTKCRQGRYPQLGQYLKLDWNPLYLALRKVLKPISDIHQESRKAAILKDLAIHARLYFVPSAIPCIFNEILSQNSSTTGSLDTCIALRLLALLLPDVGPDTICRTYREFFPALEIHWRLEEQSSVVDRLFLEVTTLMARAWLADDLAMFSEYGVFERKQSEIAFAIIERLFRISIHEKPSPSYYFKGASTIAFTKHPNEEFWANIATMIVKSLSPLCSDK